MILIIVVYFHDLLLLFTLKTINGICK